MNVYTISEIVKRLGMKEIAHNAYYYFYFRMNNI